jgi:4-hydroxybenzoate polyprenyltransferase
VKKTPPGYDQSVESGTAQAASDSQVTAVGTVRAYFTAARPLQWTKNLLLFAGLIFAERYGDASSWLEALLIFAAYCAGSSASYFLNDVLDAERDRRHPVKASRPVASGVISPHAALAAAGVLVATALALTIPLGWPSTALLAGFLALQAAYSVVLKHLVLVDVVVIACLFVIRAAAGALALEVRLSPWLVLCTGLLALFLALTKRRAELSVSASRPGATRPVLGGYSIALVDQLVGIVAASTISAYSLYTFTASDSSLMMVTIPFVVLGLFRYLQLVHAPEAGGGEPERTLVTDVPLLVTIAFWSITAVVILVVD